MAFVRPNRWAFGIVAVAACLAAGGARAAPQMLGLVATAEDRPMTCEDGVCRSYLSSFCLEKDRPPPAPGTAYRPLTEGAVTLVLTRADGGELRLDGGSHLALLTRSGYTGIEARVEEALLRAHGAVRAAVAVAPSATLLPEARPDDPAPHAPAEIAAAAGPLRALAARHLESGGTVAEAAALANRLINALPTQAGVVETAAAWAALAAGGPAGRARVEDVIASCQASWYTRVRRQMRDCLIRHHDDLMQTGNAAYWEAISRIGS